MRGAGGLHAWSTLAPMGPPASRPPLLTEAELETLARRTLEHYDAAAEAFLVATRDHDVAQNYAALLGAIEGSAPFKLLDFGCGPGRDLRYFRALGHLGRAPSSPGSRPSGAREGRGHAGRTTA